MKGAKGSASNQSQGTTLLGSRAGQFSDRFKLCRAVLHAFILALLPLLQWWHAFDRVSHRSSIQGSDRAQRTGFSKPSHFANGALALAAAQLGDLRACLARLHCDTAADVSIHAQSTQWGSVRQWSPCVPPHKLVSWHASTLLTESTQGSYGTKQGLR